MDDKILTKVRGLIAKAESLSQSGDPDQAREADACRKMADAMMLKYAIDAATLRNSQPADVRAKPTKIKVGVCEVGSPYERWFMLLVQTVAEHCRCMVLVGMANQTNPDLIAAFRSHGYKVTATVYGWESDLRYFEILYTSVLLHMSGGIDPRPDFSLTDGENAFRLHNSGFNWGEIARMYYGRHEHGWDGSKVLKGEYYPGKYWKREYDKYIRKNSLERVSLPPKFTESARLNYRLNFARSYATTITKRLWMDREARDTGAALVLASSMEEIRKLWDHDKSDGNIDYGKDNTKYNEQAWAAGNAHGKNADLSGSARMAGRTDVAPREIG